MSSKGGAVLLSRLAKFLAQINDSRAREVLVLDAVLHQVTKSQSGWVVLGNALISCELKVRNHEEARMFFQRNKQNTFGLASKDAG